MKCENISQKIVEEIKNLKMGESFIVETYLNKYEIDDVKEMLNITFKVIAEIFELVELKTEVENFDSCLPWKLEYSIKTSGEKNDSRI